MFPFHPSALIRPLTLTAGLMLLTHPFHSAAQSSDQPGPVSIAASTTMTARTQTGQILSSGTLMQQNVGRRMELYREAGISQDKLSRLEFLHQDLFGARLSGETTRSLDLRRRIDEAITPEERAAVETVLRRSTLRLRSQVVARRPTPTTGTITAQNPSPGS